MHACPDCPEQAQYSGMQTIVVKSAGRGGSRARLDRFLVTEARLAQMDMQVD